MEKKIIIGISTFAGSNIPRIIDTIKGDLPSAKIYSLSIIPFETIKSNILLENEATYYFIEGISSVGQMELITDAFKEYTYKNIFIKVPQEDCYAFLQNANDPLVSKDEQFAEWRKRFDEDDNQKAMLACYLVIKETLPDHILKWDEGNCHECIGALIDEVLRL